MLRLRLASRAPSLALQIRLPGVDRHPQTRFGRLAPQLAAVERHRVEPLRVFARTRGVAVGKDMTTEHSFDDADTATHVLRQPRMGGRMDILGAHALPCGKWRR